MTISSIRTIATNKAAITVAAVTLLGGGAALAAPDSAPPDDVPPEFAPVPLDTIPPEEVPVDPEPTLEEETDLLDGPEADDALYPPVPLVEDEAIEDEAEDDGPGWALGRQDEGQEERVQAFCDARIEEAGANDSNGVPPFCTAGEDDSPIPPNAFGQRMAEAARGGEFAEDEDEGAGPPPWAGRPGGASDEASGDDVEVERAGPPAGVPAGPPAGRPGRG